MTNTKNAVPNSARHPFRCRWRVLFLINLALGAGLWPTFEETRARADDTPALIYPPPREVKAAFLKQLDRPRVPLDPLVASVKPAGDGLVEERFSLATERKPNGDLERVPLLLVRPEDSSIRRAVSS